LNRYGFYTLEDGFMQINPFFGQVKRDGICLKTGLEGVAGLKELSGETMEAAKSTLENLQSIEGENETT
jgi:putative methionine-R-sulfoxide reductase with GAF domain